VFGGEAADDYTTPTVMLSASNQIVCHCENRSTAATSSGASYESLPAFAASDQRPPQASLRELLRAPAQFPGGRSEYPGRSGPRPHSR
jgi:hypothetical protein